MIGSAACERAAYSHFLPIMIMRSRLTAKLVLLFLAAPSFAQITAVKQVSYNSYEITATGGGTFALHDEEKAVIPTTTAGNVVTITDYESFGNNVKSATQTIGATTTEFAAFDTWHYLYLKAANDGDYRKQITEGKGDLNGNWQLYTPRMTVSGTDLTITSNRAAPILTQAVYRGHVVSMTAADGALGIAVSPYKYATCAGGGGSS